MSFLPYSVSMGENLHQERCNLNLVLSVKVKLKKKRAMVSIDPFFNIASSLVKYISYFNIDGIKLLNIEPLRSNTNVLKLVTAKGLSLLYYFCCCSRWCPCDYFDLYCVLYPLLGTSHYFVGGGGGSRGN